MRRTALAVIAGLLVSVGVARADVAKGDASARGWFVGANMSTDQGPHRVRLGGGARFGKWAVSLALDLRPLIDIRQNDSDAYVEYMVRPGGWAALAGWRTSAISIDRGRHWQQLLLLGGTAGLPSLFDGRVRARFGALFIATVVRHGAGLETQFISLTSSRHYKDLLGFSLFLRFEYASPL